MNSNAQAPQGIPYQSVIRNGSGALLINQAVNVRFSIHDSTALGTIVYQETHTTTTANTQFSASRAFCYHHLFISIEL